MKGPPIRARLLDALLSGITLPPLPASEVALSEEMVIAHNAALQQILSGATCIEATNVARFFDENYMGHEERNKAGDGKAFWSDLKCLVPPYQKFFIEWDRPSRITSAKRMGMLFIACKPELADGVARTILGDSARATPAKIAEFRKDARCRWIYLTMDFLEFPHKNDGEHISGLRGAYHVGTISVADDGSLLDFWMSHGSVLSEQESIEVGVASLVAWTTLSMLNCANITSTERRAPEAFQKARSKAGKRPLVSYHTIRVDLDSTPKSIAAESLPDGSGETPRRHRKRGHIKDYRGGKGLFGRYKGVWYWGPSLAGSANEGIVVSDYEVRP